MDQSGAQSQENGGSPPVSAAKRIRMGSGASMTLPQVKPIASAGTPTKRSRIPSTPIQLPDIRESDLPTDSRHRCPHKPQPLVNKSHGPCTISEYAQTYHAHPMEPTASFKPNQLPQQTDAPLDDKTTQRVDYVKHPLEKPHVHQAESYKKPEGSFDPLTVYTKDYPKKQAERTKPVKQVAQKRDAGRFEGDPTYKIDYRRWTPQPRAPIINDTGYRPPTAPFDGQANYTSDYKQYPIDVRQSMKPIEQQKSGGAFDDTTGYRVDYTKHPLPPKVPKAKHDWAPNKAGLDDLTNYKKDYIAKQAGMTKSCKPDPAPYNSGAPLNDETTQRIDFKKWPAERPFYHQPDAYQKPDGDMNFGTTTGRDYTKKEGERVAARKPLDRQTNPGKFLDDTTHKNDFRQWPMDGRQQPKLQSGYVPNDAPFEGQTTVQRDYVEKRALVRQSMKPMEAARKSDAPFDGNPQYKQEYVKHMLPERFRKEKAVYQPNGARLDDLSNYKKDYGPKEMRPNPSCKPDAAPYNSGAPLADETTQRNDFQKWPSERPFYHQPDAYQKPDGDMNFGTTTGRDYTKKPILPVKLRKPSASKRDPGKFQGNTDYKDSYLKWGLPENNRVPFRSDYNPPTAPFQGTTVYDDDFKAKQQAMRNSMKPAENTGRNNAPFEGNTMYRAEYIPKDIAPCPAGVIEGGGATTYRFSGQDPTGHKWYSNSQSVQMGGSRLGSAARQPVALSVC